MTNCNTNNVKIYSAMHKPHPVIKNCDYLVPIHVGAGQSDIPTDTISPYAIRDDSGKNISSKNSGYCELTGQYWVWKNTRSDYVGFFHYRRYLTFRRIRLTYKRQKPGFLDKSYARFLLGMSPIRLNSLLEDKRVILPPPTYLEASNLYDQYALAHNPSDLDLALGFLLSADIRWNQYVERLKTSPSGYFKNIFIASWDFFDGWMRFIMPILEHVEGNKIDVFRDQDQSRLYGFLAERLFNIYLWKMQDDEGYSVLNFPIVKF